MIDITLKGIWDFIKPVLSNSFKEYLKTRSSEDIAKKRAFNLYKSLSKVRLATQDFINELKVTSEKLQTTSKILQNDSSRSTTTEPICYEYAINQRVWDDSRILVTMEKLLDSLEVMVSALYKINPQLEIHKNEIVKKLADYQAIRAGSVVQKLRDVLAVDGLKLSYLQILTEEAVKNSELLDSAIDDFRLFLSSEFSFKESF